MCMSIEYVNNAQYFLFILMTVFEKGYTILYISATCTELTSAHWCGIFNYR